jgi:hypothetical protein
MRRQALVFAPLFHLFQINLKKNLAHENKRRVAPPGLT